ncbi:MAG: TRAP transporter permease [Kiloniellales bacterium]
MARLGLLLTIGQRRKLSGPLKWITEIFAGATAIAVVYCSTLVLVDLFAMTIAFVSAIMALVFLMVGATEASDAEKPSPLDFLFSAVAIAAGLYFFFDSERIITRITLLDDLTTWDVVFSSALLFLTLEGTRRTVGLGLTAIVLIFLAYNLWGHVLPGKFGHGFISYRHFLDVMMFTTDGLFGVPVRVAATYAFLFVLFGTFLSMAGGSDFFFNLAAAVSGRSPGGPGKIAVISSGLYGMISGSPTSDVVTTGSVTIPIMKRLGYSATLAGGIEVAASTGGGYMPPVMGSAAFIMAEYTGIDYREIAIAATVPALLYYLCIYLQVHFRSLKMGLAGLPKDQIPRMRVVMKDGGLFLVPLAVLTGALLYGYSPSFVAVFGAISVLAVATLKRSTRMGLLKIWQAFAETTLRMVSIVAACAAAGLIIGGLTMTGLAAKFADLIFLIAGDSAFIALVIAALVAILLGCGMPTPSAFILAAVLVSSTLTNLGLSVMQSNMFLLYFSALSAMTPPVAVAAFAAAAIADANPLKIAAVAVRLGISAFVVPFAFVYGEGLLLQGDLLTILRNCVTAGAGVALLAVAVEGHFRDPLEPPVRFLLAAAGLLLIAPSALAFLVALLTVGVAVLISSNLRNQLRPGFRADPRRLPEAES